MRCAGIVHRNELKKMVAYECHICCLWYLKTYKLRLKLSYNDTIWGIDVSRLSAVSMLMCTEKAIVMMVLWIFFFHLQSTDRDIVKCRKLFFFHPKLRMSKVVWTVCINYRFWRATKHSRLITTMMTSVWSHFMPVFAVVVVVAHSFCTVVRLHEINRNIRRHRWCAHARLYVIRRLERHKIKNDWINSWQKKSCDS